MTARSFDIGMVGLGVMGRSLALNMADHGHAVAGYDKDVSKGQLLLTEGTGKPVGAAQSPAELAQLLRTPRAIMILVAPAPVVDYVINDFVPVLEEGDLLIDAGNSYFRDTDRRANALAGKGIRFFGMGVSGGESGARHGPSMMPGGPPESWERVRPILESVAAQVSGEPCVTYVGRGSAGHYVKTVHNGIEYGLMQLLAECYDLLKRGCQLSNHEIAQVFQGWNESELNSYLVEITARICTRRDDLADGDLVDRILDVSRQKGTGKWTSQEALDLGVPIPTIDVAVSLRNLSGDEQLRKAAHQVLRGPTPSPGIHRATFLPQLRNAYAAAMVLTYAQGMELLSHASKKYDYGLNLAEVARIWRGGCIIRAALLNDLRAAYQLQPALPNPVLDPTLAARLSAFQADLRAVVATAAGAGIPAPGLMASLVYYDSLRAGWLPANLIQAQRDYFGAHTYERTDRPGTFHTHWE